VIKAGVDVEGLQPEMVLAVALVKPIIEWYGTDFVITSALDGKHSANSLHYKGRALDIRHWGVPAPLRPECVKKMQTALGGQYDVVAEATHFHIEFDVK
jgi:hypothetical protein